MNPRTAIGRALHDAGLTTALLALRQRSGSPWLSVLTYHRAAEADAVGELDPGVVDVRPRTFDGQLAFMKKWFDIVGMDDFFEFRRGGDLPKNPLLLTFDDGYIDNYEVILPMLQKHGIRATFFIATSYLEERRLFWWDKITLLVNRTTRSEITMRYPSERTFSCADEKSRLKTRKFFLQLVKHHYGLDIDRFLDELTEASGVSLTRDDERKLADRFLMTWDHVRALRRAGMDIQSHTHTHRVLQTIDAAQLDRELSLSREILEGVLKEPVRAVSYPVGKPLHMTPDIRRAVGRAGYELGFSNATGTNSRWDFDPLDARRLATDVDVPEAQFQAILAMPYLMPPHAESYPVG